MKFWLLVFFALTCLYGTCQSSSPKMEAMDYLSITFLDANGEKIYDAISSYTEAQFPSENLGFEKYLSDYMQEHLEIRRDNTGMPDVSSIWFNVQFTVNKQGSISDIKTFIENDPFYDKQILKAIEQMPDWIPATIADTTVAQVIKRSYRIPINLKLIPGDKKPLQVE
jgi:hypothetical protein